MINTNFVKNGCFFLMSFSRLYPGIEMSFEHHSVRKNIFLSAFFSWNSWFFPYVRWTKILKLPKPLGIVIRTWSSYFVISKYLDDIHYYMMLLEQWAPYWQRSWLLLHDRTRTRFMFAWSRDWTNPLPVRKTLSTFHFQLCRYLKKYILHCTGYWAGR